MSEKESVSFEHSKKITLDELMGLSMAELVFLQHLLNYSGSIVRFALLQEINAYMVKEKKISPSSFYHSLNKLQEKGFVTFEKTGDDKISTVRATPLARQALAEASRILLIGAIDVYSFSKRLLNQVLKQFQMDQELNTVLLVPMDLFVSVKIINLVGSYANNPYILANEYQFERLKIRGLAENMEQSKLSGGHIREPNDFFDAVVLFRWGPSEPMYGISREDLINELVRVLKPGGLFFVSGMKKVEKTHHFLLDGIAEALSNAYFMQQISEEELQKDLERFGFVDTAFMEYEGFLVSRARIPNEA